VEIFVAAGDLTGARNAAVELQKAAEAAGSLWLRGMALHADGALLLAEQRSDAALTRLRDALVIWRDLEMPYDAARTHEAMAAACAQLGDAEGARLEREAAARLFREIGAVIDLERVDRPHVRPETADGLTAREVEVLQQVARGQTNRSIAKALRISEKTVARHLSNIFTKLDLSTRAAATAYAFRKGLVN
jgi:DNA-binding NarL/FixJ family response regulator